MYSFVFMRRLCMSFFEKFGKSALELRSVRCLTVTGVLIALDLVLKMLSIKITADLKITFAYIALATVGMLFGPTVAFIAGALTDIIGFFFTADGGFSPLFTIVEAVGAMIYGIFLYEIRPLNINKDLREKGTSGFVKNIPALAVTGVVCGAVFTGIMALISYLMSGYVGSEGAAGKIAAVLTDGALLYAAGIVGFIYGVFFAVIIKSNSGNNGDMKSSVMVIISKVAVVVICNLIMTPAAMIISGYSTTESMIGGFPLRLVKNAIQCPVDCLILLIVLFPILSAYRRIFPKSGKRMIKKNRESLNG